MVLPESYIHQVHVGDELPVFIPSLQSKEMTGEIITVNPAADSANRSFLVKVRLPDFTDAQAGMFARVRVPVGVTGMMLVPETAVIQMGQLCGVYLVDADQIAHFRLIRTGRSSGGRVEIISGLKPGDRYITAPGPTIVDGVKVEAL